jgi:hypothetical protein
MLYLGLLLFALFTYVAWTYIHEYAHLLMTKRFIEVKDYTIKPYPHHHPTLGFVFGSVSYDYDGELDPYELAWCSFAPRIPDIIGCAIFTLNIWNPFFLVFFGGAVIDLFRGSLPLRPTSDVCRYSKGWGWRTSLTCYAQIIVVSATLLIKFC